MNHQSMGVKRLLLINPVNKGRIGLSVNNNSRFPPLGLGIVASLTPSDWKIRLIDENWESFQFTPADLVGISAFTASITRAYEIAAIYRKRGIPVVLGGIHVSMCPEEAKNFADSVIIGEAEGVWHEVIHDFENEILRDEYSSGRCEPDTWVEPQRELFHPGYRFATLQTSRGCPLNCDFCSVSEFNGTRYRRRPVPHIIEELKNIHQRMIFFVDDNIVGYGYSARRQALELFQAMVSANMDKRWFCQASIQMADDEELLRWAYRAGCRMVFIGLESETVDVLPKTKKRMCINRGADPYEKSFSRIHSAGMSVLGAFIFGFDGDTPNSLETRGRYMIQSGVDAMQVTYLTPLPGTRLFKEYMKQGRIKYDSFPNDWANFDMSQIVYHHVSMSSHELEDHMHMCVNRMYRYPVLIRKAARTLARTRSMEATAFAWSSNLNYRRVAKESRR